MSLIARLGLEHPVVQAGMGGGVARAELAAAVSGAGALGTVGFMGPDALAAQVRAVRERTHLPVAVNLLLPFARRRHWEAAAAADLIVTFWGPPRRLTHGPWVHQAGSVDEVRAAVAAGADAVIVQGVEAGGHVRGSTPATALLEAARSATPPGFPLWLAGGIADRADVLRALDAGAEAAVLGTRFLMTPESRAHPDYKARVGAARETIHTELFGAGWPAPHRVVANGATDRWLRAGEPPAAVRLLQRATAPALRRIPERTQVAFAALQRPGIPLLSPQPPTQDGPPGLVDSGPLYAGETAARIDDVRPAAELVRALAP